MDQKVSREREVDWLSKKLANLEIDKAFSLAAEVDRKIIASASIDRLEGFQKHVGLARVIIKKEFRDMDIGTGIMKILEEQAHNMGLKVLTLSVFARINVHSMFMRRSGLCRQKLFQKIFQDCKYIDEIIMTKLLK